MRYAYPARLKATPSTILATFRDLPEAIAEGKTRAAAIEDAAACLDAALWFRLKGSDPIPEPSPLKRGEVLIELPPSDAAKIAFAAAFRDSGLSRLGFATQLGID